MSCLSGAGGNAAMLQAKVSRMPQVTMPLVIQYGSLGLCQTAVLGYMGFFEYAITVCMTVQIRAGYCLNSPHLLGSSNPHWLMSCHVMPCHAVHVHGAPDAHCPTAC